MDNQRPVPLCVRFLRTRHGVSRTHQARGRRTPEFGTGAQCAKLHRRPRARRLAAGSQLVCHVDFVLPRRRLTHLCRKPRVPRWRLHICVQSRAPGQNSSSYRCVRPNWLLNSPSFMWWSPWWVGDGRWQREVRSHCLLPHWLSNSTSLVDVPDETVTAPAVCQGCTATFLAMTTPLANGVRHGSQRSLPRSCRRRVIELEQHRVAHLTSAFLQALHLNCNGSRIGLAFCGSQSLRGGSMTSTVAVCAILCRRVV